MVKTIYLYCMSLPQRLYKFGSTSFPDIMIRFKEETHESFGFRSVPLARDYTIRPLWSIWLLKEEARKAEKWFDRTYPKNFYCDIPYNGVGECREWNVEESRAFYTVLVERFPRDIKYDTWTQKLLLEGTITETHRKVYYILLTKK